MSIKMIDAQLAEHVLSQLIPGEMATFLTGPENKPHFFKVLELKDYSVIVETIIAGRDTAKPITQKLELSIAKSELYQKEIATVAMMEIPKETTPTPRGRPKGSTNKTAAAVPTQQPAAAPSPPQQAFDWQTHTQQHPLMEGVRTMLEATKETTETKSSIDFEDDFIEKAVKEMVGNLETDLLDILKTIYISQPPRDEPKPVKLTCFDCMFANVPENKCDKFQITPPMFVMADAKTQCPDFVSNDEPPF